MWSILYLPAILDDGSPLWPEKFDLKKLEQTKAQMGTALFSCMFLGRPEGLAGEVFRASWFRACVLRVGSTPSIILEPPHGGGALDAFGQERVPVDEAATVIPFDRLLIYQGWDLAISEKQTADYTVCLTLGLDTATMNYFILDVARGHWSFAKTQEMLKALAEQWRPHLIGIESTAYQAAAVQQARDSLPFPVMEARTDRDKVTRSRLPAAIAEGAKMYIVRGVWTDRFLNEVSAFPNDAHDDQVDALSVACAIARTYVPSEFVLFG